MFQYAAGKSISLVQSRELMLDTSAYGMSGGINRTDRNLDVLDFTLEIIPEDSLSAIQRRFPFGVLSKARSYFQKKCLNKYYYGWHPELYKVTKLEYLDGYFQSKEYSEIIKDCIKRSFTLKPILQDEISKFRKIFEEDKFIALHIRRGDYFSDSKIRKWHGICDENYYQKGVNHLKKNFPDYRLAVFSDDLEWAKSNIRGIENAFSVADFANNHGIKLRASQELILMSYCRHFLISNSTYSWWAQYLSCYDGKTVIAPSKWNRNPKSRGIDLMSSEWHTIEVK